MLLRKTSPSLHHLADYLANYLKVLPDKSPFEKPWIIVQNKETEQWLNLELAQRLGISANIEFLLPSELLWKLYRKIDPSLPEVLPSDRIPMQWKIFELLGNPSLEVKGAPYLKTARQRLGFAAQLADVYDLYQMFRPDMLAQWEQGEYEGVPTQLHWQISLWNQLTASWKNEFADLPARYEVWNLLETAITTQHTVMLPGQLVVFGLSQWSKPFTRLLEAISKKTKVVFLDVTYRLTNSNTPRYDVLRGWLSPKQESEQLFREAQTSEESLDIVEHLQHHVTCATHVCHNPKREVEVLKNELLALLDTSPHINPDDILIMVPDVQTYGPIIEHEFNLRPTDPVLPVYIPENYNRHNVIELLLLVFNYLTTQQKISGFIELLEQVPIQKRWGILPEEIAQLQTWMAEMHTHWGVNADTSPYSLEQALRNLYLGFCMETEKYETVKESVPFYGATGSDYIDLLTRISGIVHFLKQQEPLLKEHKSAEEWLSLCEHWCAFLYPKEDLNKCQRIETLRKAIYYAQSTTPISVELFVEWLRQQVQPAAAQSSHFGHGVVVSSYIPYRNIPFKVVAILGFNESTFPRNPVRPVFDLMAQNLAPGERLIRTDDELLFAERLAATTSHLHLSYIKGAETEQPSILLQQLQEMLGNKFSEVIPHKLHPFDEVTTLGAKNYSSYIATLANTRNEITSLEAESPLVSSSRLISLETDRNPILLNELTQFFSHPCKYLGKNYLDITSPFEHELVSDRENFTLKGLEKYQVKNLIKEGIECGCPENMVKNYLRARGYLPNGTMGEDEFFEIQQQVEMLFEGIQQFTQSEPTSIELAIPMAGRMVEGRIAPIYDQVFLNWRIGEIYPRHMVQTWVLHLAANVHQPTIKTLFLGIKDSKIHSITFDGVDNAVELLEELIDVYLHENMLNKLSMIPECSFAYVEEYRKEENHDRAQVKALHAWEGGYQRRGAKDDFYNRWFWKDRTPVLSPDFTKLAKKIWEPVFKNLKKEMP